MYRPQHYESRGFEMTCHEQAPFFRETVTLIDECSKLPKDDRIVLRNKMKQYVKGLRQNRLTQNQEEMDYYNQLIQIFIEANKKKPLSKIQKGDKAMDWLQIKLRKFIDFNKKEKHRKQLQNFRKGKFVDHKQSKEIPSRQMKSRNSKNDKDIKHILGASRGTNQHSTSKQWMPSSLSRSREKQPLRSSRKQHHQSYAQYSYHQNFSFLKKNQNQSNSSSIQKDHIFSNKRASNLNRSLDTFGKANRSFNTSQGKINQHQSKPTWNKWTRPQTQTHQNHNLKQTQQIHQTHNQNHVQKQTNNVKPMARDDKQSSKQEISRLTKLFSEQLNSDSRRQSESSSNRQQLNQQFSHLDQEMRSNPIEIVSNREQPKNIRYQSLNKYEESNKKIQQMLEGSKALLQQISSRRQHTQQRQQQPETQPTGTFKFPTQILYQPKPLPEVSHDLQIHALNPPSKASYDEIFTPPDFLAECRKFIQSSHKKTQKAEEKDEPTKTEVFYEPQMTFSDLLSKSRQQKEPQQNKYQYNQSVPFNFGQVNINEVVSQNVSAGLSTKKEESQVVSQLKSCLIRSPEELLLQLFGTSHQVSMDRFQLGQLMARCTIQTERLLQKYCEVLERQTNNASQFRLNFVAVLKYFFSFGGIFREEDNHFSYFLCSILDMKKSGYLQRSQINDFIQSLQSSEIQQETLTSITQLLNRVFEKGCQIEGSPQMVTRWSLYYMELTNDSSFCQLRDILNGFQFQVDSDE